MLCTLVTLHMQLLSNKISRLLVAVAGLAEELWLLDKLCARCPDSCPKAGVLSGLRELILLKFFAVLPRFDSSSLESVRVYEWKALHTTSAHILWRYIILFSTPVQISRYHSRRLYTNS